MPENDARAIAFGLAAGLVLAGQAALASPLPLGRLNLVEPFAIVWPQAVTSTDLAGAMQAYRARMTRTAAAYPQDAPYISEGIRFRWTAPDGAALRRVAEGMFDFVTANCLDRFCREIRCEAAGWPKFSCTDGVEREMSAPDLATVLFDGVTYTRTLPPLLEPVPDPVIPE